MGEQTCFETLTRFLQKLLDGFLLTLVEWCDMDNERTWLDFGVLFFLFCFFPVLGWWSYLTFIMTHKAKIVLTECS